MVFYHPKKYKELHGLTSRKCNTRQRAQGSLPANGALNSDQTISLRAHDGERERATGPGLQQVIEETVPHNDIEEASSDKQQASSSKLIKQQATSIKPRG